MYNDVFSCFRQGLSKQRNHLKNQGRETNVINFREIAKGGEDWILFFLPNRSRKNKN